MAASWTLGDVVEYQNGFFATVEHVDGAFAILREHPDPRVAGTPGYVLAVGDPDEFSFPYEGEDEATTLELALAQLTAEKALA